MKTLGLIFSLFFSVALFAQPHIKIEEMKYDFGNIKEGKLVTHEFKVKNIGTENLKLIKINTSCGCTAVLTKKTNIAPKDSTYFRIEFNTYRRIGPQKKHIYVFSNDPKNKQVRVTFTANIIKKTEAERLKENVPLIKLETDFVDFGDVERGKILHREIGVKNIGKKTLMIQYLRSSCSCLSAYESTKYIKPGETGKIIIDYDTTDRLGKMSRTITIISNDPYNTYRAIVFNINIVEKAEKDK